MSTSVHLDIASSSLALQTRGNLYALIERHAAYLTALSPDSAVFDDESGARMSELWSCLSTVLVLNRNTLRTGSTLIEADPYWKKTQTLKETGVRLLTMGNTWRWPRWANGFEYINLALRAARLLFVDTLTSAEACAIMPWLVRQAIYHDDLEEARLQGVTHVQQWGELLGAPRHTCLPGPDEPLAYWLLGRLYEPHIITLHRELHGDVWCSWKGLVLDRDSALDLSPLNELLAGAYHPVINPLEAATDGLSLPCDLADLHDDT